MLEYLKNKFIDKNQIISKPFEQTYQYLFLTLISENLPEKISKKKYHETINESKFVTITINNSIKNHFREKYSLEFNYLDLQKNVFFLKNEKKIIMEVLELINNILYKDFKYKYIESKEFFRITKINKKFNPNKSNRKITNNLKYQKLGYCTEFSFIYLSIFEMLNFPLEKVTLSTSPQHVFLRYIFNDSKYINWETTKVSENILDDNHYINSDPDLQINTNTIKLSKYLSNYTKEDILSFIYLEISYLLNEFNKYKLTLKYSRKAYLLNPYNPEILTNYISAKIKLKDFSDIEKLGEDLIKANSIDIENKIFYLNILGTVYTDKTHKKKVETKNKIDIILEELSKFGVISKNDKTDFYLEFNI